jgi:hypothetical protein
VSHVIKHTVQLVGSDFVVVVALLLLVLISLSIDYVHWRYSTVPAATFTYTSAHDNKTKITLSGRERPELLLSDDGNHTPLALYSGANHAKSGGGGSAKHKGTFTFVQGTSALAEYEAKWKMESEQLGR